MVGRGSLCNVEVVAIKVFYHCRCKEGYSVKCGILLLIVTPVVFLLTA